MAMAPDFNLEILLAYCTRISPSTFLMKYINDAATAVKEAKKDFGRNCMLEVSYKLNTSLYTTLIISQVYFQAVNCKKSIHWMVEAAS